MPLDRLEKHACVERGTFGIVGSHSKHAERRLHQGTAGTDNSVHRRSAAASSWRPRAPGGGIPRRRPPPTYHCTGLHPVRHALTQDAGCVNGTRPGRHGLVVLVAMLLKQAGSKGGSE